MEYAKDAELIKANDLKRSLNIEKSKNIELMDKLNQEKKRSNQFSEQLFEANEQISNLKERLNIESLNHIEVCRELELERNSNECHKRIKNLESDFFELEKVANSLDSLLIKEKSKNEVLSKAYNEIRELKSSKRNSIILNNNNLLLEKHKQSLELLLLKLIKEIEFCNLKPTTSTNDLKDNLNAILKELKDIHYISDDSNHGKIVPINRSNTNNSQDKLMEQNKELIKMLKELSDEKSEYKSTIVKLQEQVSLKQSKQSTNGSVEISDTDREKFKKLYFKYLRAESFRKSLVYQKKFLLIMLSGYEETEREILSSLQIDKNIRITNNDTRKSSYYNNQNIIKQNLSIIHIKTFYSNRFLINKPKNHFRSLAFCIIAVKRIKYYIFCITYFELIFYLIFLRFLNFKHSTLQRID
jgi:hypothetical protein